MADKNSSIAPAPHEVPFIGAKQDSAEAKPKRRQAAKIKAAPPAPAPINVINLQEAVSARAAAKTLTEKQKEGYFGPAIDAATMRVMEEGATSKDRGTSRRYALLAMARDTEALATLSRDNPAAYGSMREAIDDFKHHARALLEVAEAASLRMSIADCRDNAPALA